MLSTLRVNTQQNSSTQSFKKKNINPYFCKLTDLESDTEENISETDEKEEENMTHQILIHDIEQGINPPYSDPRGFYGYFGEKCGGSTYCHQFGLTKKEK